MLSWIPGTPLSQSKPLETRALRNAAAFQARLARGLRGFFHPHARHFVAWDIQRALLLDPGVQAWVADDAKALCADFDARLQREVLPRLPALRAQVVHGDGHADNLLRAGSGTRRDRRRHRFRRHGARAAGAGPRGDARELRPARGDVARERGAQVEAWNAVLPLMDEELEVLHDLTLLRLATALSCTTSASARRSSRRLADGRAARHRARAHRFLELDRAEVHERYRAACGRVGRAPANVDVDELRARRARALGPSYRLFYDQPVQLVRGEGTWLYDADGRRYLDCYNNVASVGHCHPRVVAALARRRRRSTRTRATCTTTSCATPSG